MSERERRQAAYRESVATVLAFIEGEDADLFNLLDKAVKEDALVAMYRMTKLAAVAVESLAEIKGEEPSQILDRLLRPSA